MRKLFLLLILTFSLLCPLAAQDSTSSTEELNEQYEQFSWEPVAKAKEYGVAIEKYDPSTDTWSEYKTVKTKETQLEVLFTPGTFRVSISTYNLIGRKGKSSDWVIFKILEEHIPYLNERFLPKSKEWNAPVLYTGNSTFDDFITAPEGFDSNTLLIKGRNIFSPRTEFYLVPKDQNSEGGKEFINYCDDRKEQKLTVVQRNSKDYSVVVSYNASKLRPGYYALEVRNTGDNRDSIELLVLDDTVCQIQPEKGFEVDEHYNVNSFTVSSFNDYEFKISGRGLNSDMKFYLEPASGNLIYPFETEIPRTDVELAVTEATKLGDGLAQLTITCPASSLRTGYYNLIAKNWNGEKAKFICLVKKPFDHDYTKQLKKVKTKYNKKTEFVDITLVDDKLDLYKTYTLVSEYDEATDSNKRVELNLSYSGKKLVGKLTPDQLTIAKYALIIEDANSYDVVYCDIDNRLKLSESKMSDSAVTKTFFRPAGAKTEVTLDADDAGSIQYYDNDIEMTKHMPPLFTNLRFDLSLLTDSTTIIDLELDVLNFGFASLSGGYEFRFVHGETEQAAFATVRLALPNYYVQPYIGAGIGQNIVFPQDGIKDFNGALGMFKDKEQTYAFAQAGVILFTVLDVRYNLILNDLFTARYFTESLSFGFSFPLRSYKFKRKILTQYAIVNKTGTFDAAEFVEPDRKIPVDKYLIYKSDSVGGFAGNKIIEEVFLDRGVSVIEENAFADCPKLESVEIEKGYTEEIPLTIKTGAFANDTQIESIRLPSRTSVVQAGAFNGWTSGQIIVLEWNSDDTVERDLTGLINCSATVLYKDDEVFSGAYATPLEDARNWCKVNEMRITNVSVHKDDLYTLGICLYGYGAPVFRTELDSWINQESPEAVVNYLKSGDRIRFYVQGDGNTYDFILTTEGGGYFHYKFKTVEGKLTEVVIPYKKLKKYGYSSQKKLDIDNIKMCSIVPMFKGEWNDAVFFDFEVTNK